MIKTYKLFDSRYGRAKAKICFIVAVFAVFVSSNAEQRRATLRDTRTPTERIIAMERAAMPLPDVYIKIGRVIEMIEPDIAIVKLDRTPKYEGRIPTHYGCDASLTPTSILTPTGIAHKTCAAFRYIEGEVAVGDTVMVKYRDIRNKEEPEKK